MVLLLNGKPRQRWSQLLWPIVKVKRSPFTRGCNRTVRSIFTWLSASAPLSVVRPMPGWSGTLMAGLTFSIPPSTGQPAARINSATTLTFRFTRTPGAESIARLRPRFTRKTKFLGLASGYLRSFQPFAWELERHVNHRPLRREFCRRFGVRCSRFVQRNAV